MTSFFLFGSYTQDAMDGIDADRTKKAEEVINGYGGKLRSVYALLGEYDIVMIADLPGVPEALQASIALTRDTGIAFSSCPAIAVADFDRLASEIVHSAD
ncbi:MAG: GYD domain-containing protein [Spirochaetales bacterium]|nr:GYD domain-containing protein [Spirochaetales bacterium]